MAGEVDHQVLAQLLLAEWQSLRQESLEAIERRVAVLGWGTAIVGGLATAAAWMASQSLLGEPESAQIVYWILVALIPVQTAISATLWAGECMRAARAGEYMVLLESDLAALVVADVGEIATASAGRPWLSPAWETFLRQRRKFAGMWKTSQMEFPYFAIGFYLLGLCVGSAGVGLMWGVRKWSGYVGRTGIASCVLATFYFAVLLSWLYRGPGVLPDQGHSRAAPPLASKGVAASDEPDSTPSRRDEASDQ